MLFVLLKIYCCSNELVVNSDYNNLYLSSEINIISNKIESNKSNLNDSLIHIHLISKRLEKILNEDDINVKYSLGFYEGFFKTIYLNVVQSLKIIDKSTKDIYKENQFLIDEFKNISNINEKMIFQIRIYELFLILDNKIYINLNKIKIKIIELKYKLYKYEYKTKNINLVIRDNVGNFLSKLNFIEKHIKQCQAKYKDYVELSNKIVNEWNEDISD